MIIAGAGFAMMAWKEAHRRTGYSPQARVLDRICASIVPNGPSAEFYRILDSATASWPAFAGERSCGICPKVGL
jgi:hypothetical protein